MWVFLAISYNPKKLTQAISGLAVLALMTTCAMAQTYSPVALTAGSYNQAIVVPATAPLALPNCINATTGNGTALGDYSFYEQGLYNRPSLSGGNSGIPVHNTTFTNINNANMTFLMPPDYTTNNELMIDSAHTSGTFTFSPATTATNLAILCAGGGGPITVNYTVTHQLLTTETGTLNVNDWTIGGSAVAWGANGRVSSGGTYNGFSASSVNNNSPFLYANTITVSGVSPVTSITINTPGNANHANFFAVSGNAAGAAWTPISLNQNSFNVRGTVPAIIPFPVTATMDTGTNLNQINGWMSTFFESNYVRGVTGGLPPSGSTFASFTQPTHTYKMASYSGNHAILIDVNHQTANITPAFPTNCSALAFLTAGGNVGGTPMTNICIVQHTDGVQETNIFLGIDWFSGNFNGSIAFKASGRVNMSSRTLDSVGAVNTGAPYLFETSFLIADTASPVTNIVMKYQWAGSAGSTTYIMAVSAVTGTGMPVIATNPKSVNVYLGTPTTLTATVSGGAAPITNQWQVSVGGVWQNLSDGGNIYGSKTANLTIAQPGYTNSADYRFVAANAAGMVTSSVATVVVLSYLCDVTGQGDPVTSFSGSSPGNEDVTYAIENNMSKYLNFGANGGAPFVGPVGLVVTPKLGATIVSGVRIYPANDAPERDPADYTLEGSNNGGANYTLIASNVLALPATRNNSATINPIGQALQQILFTNTSSYTSYRLTFRNVKNNATANSLQIGEVELLGSPYLTNGKSVADQAYDAYNLAFMLKANGQTFFKDSLTNNAYAYMWGQALMIQMVQDAYDRNHSSARLQTITNLLNVFLAHNNNLDWSWDSWNDDVEWAILPFIRGYQMTGNAIYLTAATNNWNMVYNRGWETTIGGGGIWEEMNSKFSKCALSNDPFIISGCMLYQATGNPNYLTKCQSVYAWVRTNLFNTGNGQINECITTNVIGSGASAHFEVQASDNVYNSGTFVNAANALYQLTGNIIYYNDALLAADHVVNKYPVLHDGGRAGTAWEEQFIRGLSRFARDNNLWGRYYPWLAANANAAWVARRPDLNITWNDWTAQTIIDNSYAMECMSGAVIQQVLPTTVFGAPVFTVQPSNQVSAVGNAVTLSSLATSGGSVFYQWYHGTNPVAGATGANLALISVNASDAGNYWVLSSNSAASVCSQVASLALGGYLAQDAGSNYVANGSFGSQNQGYGFGSWVLSVVGGGDLISTSPVAFDLWNSTPLAGSTANRAFNVPLPVGGSFSLQLKNQGLSATNINGFQLQDANGNVLFKFYWQGGDSANGHYTDATVNNGSAVGFSFNSGNFSSFTFTLNSATTYTFIDNTTSKSFSGILSGSPITQVTFLRINYGSESLANGQDFQFNNLAVSVAPVTPSPAPLTLTKTPQGWGINFAVAPGYSYRVQGATNITGLWTDLRTLTGPVSGWSQFVDTNTPAGEAFYRTVTP